MANPDQEAAAGAAVADVVPTEPLAEFCRQLSASDRRLELISGFYADEQSQGRAHATRADWEARFAAFQRRPVS